MKEIAKMLFLASRQANNKLAIKLLKQVSTSLIIKIGKILLNCPNNLLLRIFKDKPLL